MRKASGESGRRPTARPDAELFAGERLDGLATTAQHYVSVYRNLLRFVDGALLESPPEEERLRLLRWHERFEVRLAIWTRELERIHRSRRAR